MKQKVYRDAPIPPDAKSLKLFRGKGKYWEESGTAIASEFMDIGMLPDCAIHIYLMMGGEKRQSLLKIDIETSDFPAILEMMFNIGGPSFRNTLRLMALRSMAEYPKEMEKLFHSELKRNASLKPMERSRDGEVEGEAGADGDRSAASPQE